MGNPMVSTKVRHVRDAIHRLENTVGGATSPGFLEFARVVAAALEAIEEELRELKKRDDSLSKVR